MCPDFPHKLYLIVTRQQGNLKVTRNTNNQYPVHTHFRVYIVFIVKDPTVTMKCRTSIKALFLYLNLCLCDVGLSLMFIYIHIRSYYQLFPHSNVCPNVMLDSISCSFTLICVGVMLASLSSLFTFIPFLTNPYIKKIFRVIKWKTKKCLNVRTIRKIVVIG